jgi:fructose-bisphosphate aldolase class 1
VIWLYPVGGGKALSNDDCARFPATDTFLTAGLVPIIEPEVSISRPHKEQAETLLRDAITKQVEGRCQKARP